MPAPLSVDLRNRVIAAYEDGQGTQVELAERFGVGEATVRRWVRRRREKGCLEPEQYRRGPAPLLDDEGLAVVASIMSETPDLTLSELVDDFADRTGLRVSTSTMSRALARAGWSRKKKGSRRPSAMEDGSASSETPSGSGRQKRT